MEPRTRRTLVAAVAAACVLTGIGCGADGGGDAGGASPSRPLGPNDVDLGNGVTMEFVPLPPGDFTMGTAAAPGSAGDQHPVTLSRPFLLGRYEVTQEQFEAVMGRNPSDARGPRHPVDQVSWLDCGEFLAKLAARVPGPAFRLPTEAEWEYACRAGSAGTYCFGDDPRFLPDYAWAMPGTANAILDYANKHGRKPHPVGEKKPNAWGLYDMHGNVLEWCSDWYDPGYAATSPPRDPAGPATGTDRVLRGGACYLNFDYARSAYRYAYPPSTRRPCVGFRVARDVR